MAIRNVLDKIAGLSLQLSTLWYFQTEGGPEDLYIYVQSTSLNFPSLEVQRDGARYQYLSNYSEPDTFSMTFLETDEFTTLNYLEAWMDEVFDRRNKVFRSGNPSRNGILTFQRFREPETLQGTNYSPPFRESIQDTRSYLFRGMILQSIDPIDLDYESSENLTISASFSADTIEPL